MTIQDWAALAEIVSAIAVVVTLIDLAVQVRHSKESLDANTKAIRGQTILAATRARNPNGGAFWRSDKGNSSPQFPRVARWRAESKMTKSGRELPVVQHCLDSICASPERSGKQPPNGCNAFGTGLTFDILERRAQGVSTTMRKFLLKYFEDR